MRGGDTDLTKLLPRAVAANPAPPRTHAGLSVPSTARAAVRAQQHEVGVAAGDDVVGLLRLRDQPDRAGQDAGVVADAAPATPGSFAFRQ